jgi:hypothetical protein
LLLRIHMFFCSVGMSHSTVCSCRTLSHSVLSECLTVVCSCRTLSHSVLLDCLTVQCVLAVHFLILFCRNVSQYSVFLPYTFSFCSVGMSHSTVCSCRTFSHSVLSECLTVQCVLTVHFLILFCRNVSQYSVFLP